VLQGTLDVLSFAEGLALAARKKFSGLFRVRTAHVTAAFHLASGQITGLDCADVSGHDLRERVEEVTARLLAAQQGTFEMRSAIGQPTQVDRALDVKDVLAGARRQLSEWRATQAAITDLSGRPQLAPVLASANVTFSRDQWRLLQAIDGRRNLRSIGREMALGPLELAKLLRSLVEAGVVSVEAASAKPPARTPGPAADGDARRRTVVIPALRPSGPAPATIGTQELETGRSRPRWWDHHWRPPVPKLEGANPDAVNPEPGTLPQAG
jgi:Domain of unknown function (DUF4388)